MEAEGLHGFCFMRKRWAEMDAYYANTLFICAINPFLSAEPDRASTLITQLAGDQQSMFMEAPQFGFNGRLIDIGLRALRQSITTPIDTEVSTPLWHGIVTTPGEVVYTHNIGFRPTGLFREAYVSYIDELYRQIAQGADLDAPTLRIETISSRFRAWEFMEACGYSGDHDDNNNNDDDDDDDDDETVDSTGEDEAAFAGNENSECGACNGTGNGNGINPHTSERMRCHVCGGSGKAP